MLVPRHSFWFSGCLGACFPRAYFQASCHTFEEVKTELSV